MIIIRETEQDNKIEALIKKYEAKDYFSDKEMIDGKIKGWQAVGSPKELKGLSGEATEESIREFLEKREHEQRIIWITGRVKRLNDKNASEIAEWLRSDQKMMKELFQIVTGVDVKNMNNTQLKDAIDEWCK